MLRLPEDPQVIVNTIGIDPGTTHLGISVMEINLETLKISNAYAYTLNGEKLSCDPLLAEHYGAKYSRIAGMMQEIGKLLEFTHPVVLSSEAPFYNPSRPIAFEALVEVISHVRNTVAQYDRQLMMHLVDPSSVKNAVGAKGGADKITIKEALSKIKDIHYRSDVSFDQLDEHSIDATAVNYWYYLRHILRKT